MNTRNAKNDSTVIWIRKASGEEEPFEAEKLRRSLKNAGAADDLASEIIDDILGSVYSGITTKKIYSRAFSLLQRKKIHAALKYKLKQAMLQLGPTGYPFEHFIGLLYEKQGYTVKIGQVVDGWCISHEMDVIASKNKHQLFIECKYSSSQGKQVSVQVPLYVQSRIDDIIKKRKELSEYSGFSFAGCLITNTRFSSDSIEYGKCRGLHLMGWDYPEGKGLKDLIETMELYPVTILNSLSKKEKQKLIDQGVVICSQLYNKPNVLDILDLTEKKQKNLMQELNLLCS